MTIKELCKNYNCRSCPYNRAGPYRWSLCKPYDFPDNKNLEVTRSIIETAIKLSESEV
jgi:hypothetical protein